MSISCWIILQRCITILFRTLIVTSNTTNWTLLIIINCQRCHGFCSLISCCRHLLDKYFVKSSYEAVDVWLCNAKCSGSGQVRARIVCMVSTKATELVSGYFLLCVTSNDPIIKTMTSLNNWAVTSKSALQICQVSLWYSRRLDSSQRIKTC